MLWGYSWISHPFPWNSPVILVIPKTRWQGQYLKRRFKSGQPGLVEAWLACIFNRTGDSGSATVRFLMSGNVLLMCVLHLVFDGFCWFISMIIDVSCVCIDFWYSNFGDGRKDRWYLGPSVYNSPFCQGEQRSAMKPSLGQMVKIGMNRTSADGASIGDGLSRSAGSLLFWPFVPRKKSHAAKVFLVQLTCTKIVFL